MKTLKILILVTLALAIPMADGHETPISLEAAKEQGRIKSRYLKETRAAVDASDANVIGKSEMPPENEPAYALSHTNRGIISDWLSEELNKASLVRRDTKEHSSFRRLTKYEYY